MRSSRDRFVRRGARATAFVLGVVVALGACGNDIASQQPVDPCASSILTYQNFGEPFMLDWCRSCHSAGVPADMRQGAPPDVDFDDLASVRAHAEQITLRAVGNKPTMPPAAGPSEEERALLAEWLACGAP